MNVTTDKQTALKCGYCLGRIRQIATGERGAVYEHIKYLKDGSVWVEVPVRKRHTPYPARADLLRQVKETDDAIARVRQSQEAKS